MDLNFSVFQEPRGVMRIIHLVFSITAFAVISGYSGAVQFVCKYVDFTYAFDYPFKLTLVKHELHPLNVTNTSCQAKVSILGDFSSDARFFVATGVLAMLYCIAIIFVYTKYDNLYKTNSQVPLTDFVLTVVFAILWLSSSAAWANGLSGLKHVTDPMYIDWEVVKEDCKCPVTVDSFSTLDISVVLGFLNFFLWAADLWFLYKETMWFQNNRNVNTSGV